MRGGWVLSVAALLCACSKEQRPLGPTPPQTRPTGDRDARVPQYQSNAYQVSQGGRYFSWYGCAGCHTDASAGALNLADGRWRRGGGFAQVFASVADAHGRLAYGARVPVEQLWQLTAYARDLPLHTPGKRRRQTLDQKAEPVGATWGGPQ